MEIKDAVFALFFHHFKIQEMSTQIPGNYHGLFFFPDTIYTSEEGRHTHTHTPMICM